MGASGEMRGFFPFDSAQGQNDNVRRGVFPFDSAEAQTDNVEVLTMKL
jgi:hypothetical protein